MEFTRISPDRILMATHDVCVWLYVKLTPYPLSHDLMGSIGWVGHGGTGPLNFARGGRTVLLKFSYIDLVLLYE